MNTARYTLKDTLSLTIFDAMALVFIYLVPTISHFFSVPLYLIEPMRFALIIALVHTTKRNAYIIAITLPLFSFLVSTHPVFYKMMLITGELFLNVWLFYLIFNRTKNAFASIFSSIVLSKALYYLVKFTAITLILKTNESIVSTSLYIQAITTFAFSAYLTFIFWKRAK
jgi:hypothetical protein